MVVTLNKVSYDHYGGLNLNRSFRVVTESTVLFERGRIDNSRSTTLMSSLVWVGSGSTLNVTSLPQCSVYQSVTCIHTVIYIFVYVCIVRYHSHHSCSKPLYFSLPLGDKIKVTYSVRRRVFSIVSSGLWRKEPFRGTFQPGTDCRPLDRPFTKRYNYFLKGFTILTKSYTCPKNVL